MAKNKKYYAVRKGLNPGIYTSWGDCQQNINGFSGAEYKSFTTLKEAESFLFFSNIFICNFYKICFAKFVHDFLI